MFAKNLVLIAFAFLLLAGCATLPLDASTPSGGAVPASPTSPSMPGSSVPDSGELPKDMPPDAVLVYHRSGGIAGIDEVWTIYSDGRITKDRGGEWQAPAERVTALLQAIDELGFFNMQASYMPADTCCDRFSYELAVRNKGQEHQVITMDGAPGTPEAFWQILTEVQRFLDEFTK